MPLPHWVRDPQELTTALLGHPAEHRVHWMRSLGGPQLRRLWTLSTQTSLPWPPEAFGQGEVIDCAGKNHMPVFSWFHKRLARVQGAVVGFNDTGWLRPLIGDGHFVVTVDDEDPTRLWFDYTQPARPTHESFPGPRSRPAPLQRWVYGGLRDEVRRVGDGLCVGRATVTGNSLQRGAYFALWLPTLQRSEPVE